MVFDTRIDLININEANQFEFKEKLTLQHLSTLSCNVIITVDINNYNAAFLQRECALSLFLLVCCWIRLFHGSALTDGNLGSIRVVSIVGMYTVDLSWYTTMLLYC